MSIGPSSATLNNDTRTLILQNLSLADVVKMREVSRHWYRSASSPRAYQHLSDITAEAIQLKRKDLKNIRRAERIANHIHEIFVAMMELGTLPLCYRKEDAFLIAQQFTQDPIELDKFQPNHPSARRDRVCAGLDLEKGVNPFRDETTKMRLIRNLLLFE
ncbi:MAG: hypothetical protein KDK65_06575, partial [Chlamydiia bacterium]|nr:hypothetical protein [Chlamydiia bacterium]